MLRLVLAACVVLACSSSPARAAGAAEALVDELVVAAREDVLGPAWIEDHVWPGPSGWTERARQAWERALAPGAPLHRVLARSAGVAHVARGEGPTRVVLDGLPVVSVLVDEEAGPRIVAIEPTSCFDCDERTRFVKDLVADVRRRGALTPRLAPGLELDVHAWVASQGGGEDGRWVSTLATYLASDATVADRIGGASVIGVDGDAVRVRYPDGREDRWSLAWTASHGWRVAYDQLAPSSPLRLDSGDVRTWRRPESVRAARLATWRPANELLPDGAGRRIGEQAVGAAVDALDDSVLLAVQALDRSVSALFRVDASDGEVVERMPLPLESDRSSHRPTEAWATRWPFAVRADARMVAAATPAGVVQVDLLTQQSTVVVPPRQHVSALAWTTAGELALAFPTGEVRIGTTTFAPAAEGVPIALHAGSQGVSWVTDRGAVVHVEGDRHRVTTVCDGDAAGASLRERDGRWLVACGELAGAGHALVPWFEGPIELYGTGGRAGPAAVAWSGDGERYAVARPGGGLVVWNDLWDEPEAAFGRRALMHVAFTADNQHLVGLTLAGDVLWWDVATALRLHGLTRSAMRRRGPS